MTRHPANPSSCCGTRRQPKVLQLPVAPRINHRIRFAGLKPGSPPHLLPHQAAALVDQALVQGQAITEVLIYGPGDPLASIEATLETLTLLAERDIPLRLALRTLGIGGVKYADKLARAGATTVELLIDGIEPGQLEKLYAWVRPGFKTLQLRESVEILAQEQQEAIAACKDAGLTVRILTTLYPEQNAPHLAQLARRVAQLGADELILRPYQPTDDSEIVLPPATPEMLSDGCTAIAHHLPVTVAAGDADWATHHAVPPEGLPKPGKERPNVAVASATGLEVDLHLGQASQVLIYGPREDGLISLLASRPAPEPGQGQNRWQELAAELNDCFALLAASAGETPRLILSRHNITVVLTTDNIEGAVESLYGGNKKNKPRV